MKNSELLNTRNVFYLRRSFRLTRRLERGILDPAAIVDIALIFFLFMITASGFVTQPGVRITLPEADNLEGIPFSSLVVTISPDRSTNNVHAALVFFDDVRTDLDGLAEAFEKMSDEKKKNTLIIQADEKVTNKVIIDVSGKAMAAGIKDVAIAARLPGPHPPAACRGTAHAGSDAMKIRQGILWSLIIALVFAWHVVWWVFLPPELPERTVRARPTSLRYISVEAGVDDDAEDLWTPTLFAYPFKAGFSKPLLKSDAGSVPPLRLVRDLSVNYPRPAQTNAPAIPIRTPALLPEVEARLSDFDFSPVVLEQHPEAVLPQLVTSIRTSPPTLLLKEHRVPDELADLTNETWQANFRVQFLENGFVERAYIELSLDSAPLRASLLAWAYGHRLREPQPGAIAAITVSHIVPYQEPEPEPEEIDPAIKEVN